MKKKLRRMMILTLIASGVLAGIPNSIFAEETELAEVSAGAFMDPLDEKDSNRWYTSNGWTNGGTFLNGWRDDHVILDGGSMKLILDDKPCAQDKLQCSEMPYASGEYATTHRYGYGKFEARMKAVKGDGVVTGFFTYGTPAEGKQDEIDVEILGKDTTRLETNYYTKGIGMHSTIIPLGFDATEAFHDYAFEWMPESIKWYVDGKLVHTETGSKGALPSLPGHIIANLWPATKTNGWAKDYVDPGFAQIAEFEHISFTPAAPGTSAHYVDLIMENKQENKVYRVGETEMAPVRFIMESLKARVSWNGANHQITVNDPASGSVMVFTIGSKLATINGKVLEMKEPVIIINGSAYTPLRVLTDTIGASLIRDEGAFKVRITRD